MQSKPNVVDNESFIDEVNEEVESVRADASVAIENKVNEIGNDGVVTDCD